jgi:hypothetical protein
VDYCHLNAITVKCQFPVLVAKELLDELGQASWFYTLDLCPGFHQIPMDELDYFKTAFQTHIVHYKFRVVFWTNRGSSLLSKGHELFFGSIIEKMCVGFFR